MPLTKLLLREVYGAIYFTWTTPPIVLKGVPDPQVLAWAAENERMLVKRDLKTIPRYAYERVVAGEAMPGVIALSDSLPIGDAIEEPATISESSEPNEWVNQVVKLPL